MGSSGDNELIINCRRSVGDRSLRFNRHWASLNRVNGHDMQPRSALPWASVIRLRASRVCRTNWFIVRVELPGSPDAGQWFSDELSSLIPSYLLYTVGNARMEKHIGLGEPKMPISVSNAPRRWWFIYSTSDSILSPTEIMSQGVGKYFRTQSIDKSEGEFLLFAL